MNEKQRLLSDGLKEVSPEDFHSFIKKCSTTTDRRYDKTHRHPQTQWNIRIPIQIVRLLNLKPDDALLIAIKKASKQEKEEYLVKK